MSYAATIDTTTSRILRAELRVLRSRSDVQGSAATIHALRNHITTAQGALSLADIYSTQGRDGDAQAMLELAEARMRDIRRLLFGSRRTYLMRQEWLPQLTPA